MKTEIKPSVLLKIYLVALVASFIAGWIYWGFKDHSGDSPAKASTAPDSAEPSASMYILDSTYSPEEVVIKDVWLGPHPSENADG